MARRPVNSINYRLYFILAGAWRRRYLVALPIILLPIIGVVIGALSPKHYQAHTSMLIQETAKMNPFLEDLAVSAMLKERMDGLQTLLHSRHILGAVALERGLIDEDTSIGERDRVIGRLSSSLKVGMAGKDLIRIDFKSNRPDGIRETLESVSAHFIEQLLAPERSSMTDSASFLSQHLESRRQELESAEQALAAYKDENGSELPALHNGNVTRLAQLQQLLSQKQAELAGARQSLGGIDQQLSRINPVLGRIEEQIVDIRGQLALLRARYTDSHSEVQAALRQVRRLEDERRKIIDEGSAQIDTKQLWDIASQSIAVGNERSQSLLVSQLELLQTQRSRYVALKEEVDRLQQDVDTLERRTAEFGEHERTLNKLERDLSVKRKLYEELLHRYEMARVTGSLGTFEQSKRVKVIDEPFTPTSPSNLPLLFYLVGGLFGGIALGIGLGLTAELLDGTVRRRDRVEKLLGIPVLSRIPPMQPRPGTT
ncbi:MAG: chain-length determining protein [Gammaproteobacteria bacterium]|nr:chain-length determining protein [Gammaproteobacteria bacterium]